MAWVSVSLEYSVTQNSDDWPKAIISTIDTKYHLHLKRGYLQLYNEHLLYFKPILMESRYISLLIFLLDYNNNFSPTIMQAQSVDTWGNTRHFIVYKVDSFGRK